MFNSDLNCNKYWKQTTNTKTRVPIIYTIDTTILVCDKRRQQKAIK